jgi:alpha-D-xyloside xylohydrolase
MSLHTLARRLLPAALAALLLPGGHAAAQVRVLGDPVDVSQDFQKLENAYFVASRATRFDPATGSGTLQWDRYARQTGYSFAKVDLPFVRAKSDEFPGTEYDQDPALPFSLTFVSPRTVRLRFATRDLPLGDSASLMLAAGTAPVDRSWRVARSDSVVEWTSPHGRVRLVKAPWRVELYDGQGKLLTRTQTLGDPNTFATPVPFSFARRAEDMGRRTAASFQLSYDEKIFGTGESFTRLDKRGQKVVAYTRDAMGVQTPLMYKPIPFFLSSRGYGVFVHTSTPVTFDFGQAFDQSNVIYTGDEVLDLFVFLGEPREVVSEYTALTGRSPVPPLWSFGLWMSRITYNSEAEVRDVAAKLRQHRIPADVLHLDTGWFEVDWQSDFQFSTSRFANPARMISDLKKDGFRVSLWQLPYFTTKNRLYPELVAKGYAVKSPAGSWTDYQTGRTYPGARWHQVEAGAVPVVLMVRDGSVIPHVAVAQSTAQIDWSNVELRVFNPGGGPATGLFALPDGELRTLRVEPGAQGPVLRDDPLRGRVRWRLTRAGTPTAE